MAKWLKIILGLYLPGLYAARCVGGQTLYPITDSSTSVPPPPRVQVVQTATNRPSAQSAISVLLKPTAIGPIGGSGLLQFKDRTALLHVSRLGPGRYELRATRRRDDIPVLLGVLTIVDPTLSPSRQATDNKKEASANPDSVSIETDVQIKLPAGWDAHDLSQVQVLGPGGNAVLSGEPGGTTPGGTSSASSASP